MARSRRPAAAADAGEARPGKRDRFLPYGRQLIEADDVAAVGAALRGDFLTTGPAVDTFERAFAERTGAAAAVACSSGTAALHLAALALGWGERDAVVVPSQTFVATANAARFVGAEVAFADVDPETGLMTPESFEAALASARASGWTPRAVLPVHLNGQCPDMQAIAEVARRAGCDVVEDACHMLGGGYRRADGSEAPVGSCAYGTMSIFSLHPVKVIAMGEGGVVTTNDVDLGARLSRLRNHGLVRAADEFETPAEGFDADAAVNPWYYEVHELGFNYRASDIHCALGLSQLRKLDRFVRARQALVDRYDSRLAPLAPTIRPIGRAPWCRPAWHLYVVHIDFDAAGIERGRLMRILQQNGIGTQVHYIPVHRQPYYRRRYGDLSLAGADAYYRRALSLPLFPGMSADDVDRVADCLQAACGL